MSNRNASAVARNWARKLVAAALVLVAFLVVLWSIPPQFPHNPTDPDPSRNSSIAIDCNTGAGYIGYDGQMHCSTDPVAPVNRWWLPLAVVVALILLATAVFIARPVRPTNSLPRSDAPPGEARA